MKENLIKIIFVVLLVAAAFGVGCLVGLILLLIGILPSWAKIPAVIVLVVLASVAAYAIAK